MRRRVRHRIGRAFHHHFEALPRDAAERAVGADQVETDCRLVFITWFGESILRIGLDAQDGDQDGER